MEEKSTQHLKGIVSSREINQENTAVIQPEVEKLQKEKKNIENQLQIVSNARNEKMLLLQKFIIEHYYPTVFDGAVIGAILGLSVYKKLGPALIASIMGGAMARLATPDQNPDREVYIKNTIDGYKRAIQFLGSRIEGLQKQLKKINTQLFKLNPFPSLKELVEANRDKKISSSAAQPKDKPPVWHPPAKKNDDTLKSNKVVSSQDLLKMEYKKFNFQGRWEDFLGQPEIRFYVVIHGKAGEGKSTFAIQFANYLASFGRVIYISGEEGFSQTFKEKFERLGATAPDLFVGDIRTFDDIVSELRKNAYHFVFIDSLDTMKMGADEMQQLRQTFPEKTFITISQSTKEGKIRGSNQLTHDCDTEIEVKEGVAVTIKNRFQIKGREFEVFKKS